jgi:hypothetical protein
MEFCYETSILHQKYYRALPKSTEMINQTLMFYPLVEFIKYKPSSCYGIYLYVCHFHHDMSFAILIIRLVSL